MFCCLCFLSSASYFSTMKLLRILFIIILFSKSAVCFAQHDKPYRSPYRLVLYVDSTRYYGQELDSTPYFGSNNLLQLYTGELLFVEVELNKKQIVSMKVVDTIVNPAKTLIIEAEQKANISKSELIYLKISNPFKHTLSYKAELFYAGAEDWVEAPVQKIKGGKTITESWKDNIVVSFLLSDWKFE